MNIGIEKKKTTGDCEKMDNRKMRSLRINDKDLDPPVLCASSFGDVRFSGIRFSQSPWPDDGIRQVFARDEQLPNTARLIKVCSDPLLVSFVISFHSWGALTILNSEKLEGALLR
ncbi:MAG: hypothetical protein WAL52_06680 [Candidatus Sulfotelmatobacter sp.]